MRWLHRRVKLAAMACAYAVGVGNGEYVRYWTRRRLAEDRAGPGPLPAD